MNSASDALVTLQPGELFPWPNDMTLTAIDELVIELPIALFGDNEKIGDVLFCSDEAEINMPPNSDNFYLRLKSGMHGAIAKSSMACLRAEDARPRLARARRDTRPSTGQRVENSN